MLKVKHVSNKTAGHCGFQIRPNKLLYQQKRFRGKINVTKPRVPHYTRVLANEFLMPFYRNPKEGKTLEELCYLVNKKEFDRDDRGPFPQIVAREGRNWFDTSKMVAIYHRNVITRDELFDFQVSLKKMDMIYKQYGKAIMSLIFENSPYTCLTPLVEAYSGLVFSPNTNLKGLLKVTRKTPQLILMAAIVEGHLLSREECVKYSETSLTYEQARLVQTLQSAGGNTLNRQLTHHQSTLVSRLRQIGTREETSSDENEQSVPV